MSLKNKRLLNF